MLPIAFYFANIQVLFDFILINNINLMDNINITNIMHFIISLVSWLMKKKTKIINDNKLILHNLLPFHFIHFIVFYQYREILSNGRTWIELMLP